MKIEEAFKQNTIQVVTSTKKALDFKRDKSKVSDYETSGLECHWFSFNYPAEKAEYKQITADYCIPLMVIEGNNYGKSIKEFSLVTIDDAYGDYARFKINSFASNVIFELVEYSTKTTGGTYIKSDSVFLYKVTNGSQSVSPFKYIVYKKMEKGYVPDTGSNTAQTWIFNELLRDKNNDTRKQTCFYTPMPNDTTGRYGYGTPVTKRGTGEDSDMVLFSDLDSSKIQYPKTNYSPNKSEVTDMINKAITGGADYATEADIESLFEEPYEEPLL